MLIKKIKNKKINYFFSLIILLFGIFFIPYNVSAATIKLSPSNGLYQVGDTIRVKVLISSDTSVNAVAAKISYPTNLLTLSSISKSNSIISLWAQEPFYSNSEGLANFEGVILYGYTGDSGNIATLVFKAKATGTANLKFNSSSILANDGSGTEVLTSKNGSTLTIIKEKTQTEIIPGKVINENSFITIKEISEGDNYYRNKFSITTDQEVKDQLYSIQIDSMNPIMWIDEGTHIFETPSLGEGSHTIRIIASDLSLNLLSGSLDFSTKTLKTPIITYYTKKTKLGEPIIIRGLADQYVDVEFVSKNKETGESIIGHAQVNIDGKFTYIPESENEIGVYSITARSKAKNGITSSYMNPIEVIVADSFFNILIAKIIKIFIIILPFLVLILFLLLIIYAIYRIKKYQNHLRDRVMETEKSLAQKFEKLEGETQGQIKDDIKRTEESIKGEMKDLEKDVEDL